MTIPAKVAFTTLPATPITSSMTGKRTPNEAALTRLHRSRVARAQRRECLIQPGRSSSGAGAATLPCSHMTAGAPAESIHLEPVGPWTG
jgi:hypothetical protein